MKKTFTQCVALIVTFGSIVDPTTAAALSFFSPVTQPSITASYFTRQALSEVPLTLEQRHPLLEAPPLLGSEVTYRPPVLASKTQSPGSRRDFFKTAALIFTAVSIRPIALIATIGYKKGIGETDLAPIQFQAFDPAVFAADEIMRQQVLPEVERFILQQNQVGPAAIAGITPEIRRIFQQLRQALTHQLLDVSEAREELLGILHNLNIRPAQESNLRADQLLYVALPRYLARRGMLFRTDFVRLDLPVDPLPTLEDTAAMESFGLYRLENKSNVNLTFWGESITVDEFQIREPMYYLNRPLDGVFKPLAQMQFGTIFQFQKEGEGWVDFWLHKVANQTGLIADFARTLWHPDFLYGGNPVDPFDFSRQKLIALESANPPTADQVRSWQNQDNRFHEAWHRRDFHVGRTSIDQLPQDTWEHYDAVINRWQVANELDARIAAARHVDKADKQRELLRSLNDMLEPANGRAYHLVYYNLFDLILTEISENLSNYPEIRLFIHPTVTIRAQIAAQLTELTSQHFDQILDAVHEVREQRREDLKMPLNPEVKELYQGPLYTGSLIERHGRKAGWTALISGTVGLLAVWHWKRVQALAASRSRQVRRRQQAAEKSSKKRGSQSTRDMLPVYFLPYKLIESELEKPNLLTPAEAGRVMDAVRKGESYTGWTVDTLKQLIFRSGNASLFRYTTDGVRFIPIQKGLMDHPRSKYLVRPNADDPQLVDVVEHDERIEYRARIRREETRSDARFITAIDTALKAIGLTHDAFWGQAKKAYGIKEIRFVSDAKNNLAEETFITGSVATIHIHTRLFEPGYEVALLGAVLKGMMNVTLRAKRGELKEAATLPPLFVHWVKAVGVEGVKAALETLGLGAAPLLVMFRVLSDKVDKEAWEASNAHLSEKQKEKLYDAQAKGLDKFILKDARRAYDDRFTTTLALTVLAGLESIELGVTLNDDDEIRDAMPVVMDQDLPDALERARDFEQKLSAFAEQLDSLVVNDTRRGPVAQIAKALKISKQRLWDLRMGLDIPTKEELDRIAFVYKKEVKDLFRGYSKYPKGLVPVAPQRGKLPRSLTWMQVLDAFVEFQGDRIAIAQSLKVAEGSLGPLLSLYPALKPHLSQPSPREILKTTIRTAAGAELTPSLAAKLDETMDRWFSAMKGHQQGLLLLELLALVLTDNDTEAQQIALELGPAPLKKLRETLSGLIKKVRSPALKDFLNAQMAATAHKRTRALTPAQQRVLQDVADRRAALLHDFYALYPSESDDEAMSDEESALFSKSNINAQEALWELLRTSPPALEKVRRFNDFLAVYQKVDERTKASGGLNTLFEKGKPTKSMDALRNSFSRVFKYDAVYGDPEAIHALMNPQPIGPQNRIVDVHVASKPGLHFPEDPAAAVAAFHRLFDDPEVTTPAQDIQPRPDSLAKPLADAAEMRRVAKYFLDQGLLAQKRHNFQDALGFYNAAQQAAELAAKGGRIRPDAEQHIMGYEEIHRQTIDGLSSVAHDAKEGLHAVGVLIKMIDHLKKPENLKPAAGKTPRIKLELLALPIYLSARLVISTPEALGWVSNTPGTLLLISALLQSVALFGLIVHVAMYFIPATSPIDIKVILHSNRASRLRDLLQAA